MNFRQVIFSVNTNELPVRHLGTNFSEIWITIQYFLLNVVCEPLCLGLKALDLACTVCVCYVLVAPDKQYLEGAGVVGPD